MKSKRTENSAKYVRYGNDLGFLSYELVDDKVIFDSENGADVDLSPNQTRSLAYSLYVLADKADSYSPPLGPIKSLKCDFEVGQKFVATHLKTGEKSLHDGICTFISFSDKSSYPAVTATDANGNLRKFLLNVWSLSKRD